MLSRLDHLVVLVRDLEQATREYERQGFTVTPGGEHSDGLTRNALISFADGSYLELVSFVDPEDPRDNVWNWRPFAALGGGLIDYCAASDGLDVDVRRLRKSGFEVNGPSSGGRKLPDGEEVRWRVARIRQQGRVLPFLIEDQTARDRRVPGGPATVHPNGACGISRLRIATPDAQQAAASYAALPGTVGAPGEDGTVFHIGACVVEVLEPGCVGGEVERRLASLGSGPFAAEFDAGGTKVIRLPAR